MGGRPAKSKANLRRESARFSWRGADGNGPRYLKNLQKILAPPRPMIKGFYTID
jgi:hypothetical protein